MRLWELHLSYGGFPKAVAAAAEGLPIPSSLANDMFNVIFGDAFRNSKLNVLSGVAVSLCGRPLVAGRSTLPGLCGYGARYSRSDRTPHVAGAYNPRRTLTPHGHRISYTAALWLSPSTGVVDRTER